MAVEYNGSTVASIDMDSKIGYKQFFSEGSRFQYSGKETLAYFCLHGRAILCSVLAHANCLKTWHVFIN